MQCVTGVNATEEHWAFFSKCYANTRPAAQFTTSLNPDFFQRIGTTMPQHTLLVIATLEGTTNCERTEFLYGRRVVWPLVGRPWNITPVYISKLATTRCHRILHHT
ncbi:MAG: peptidogalycan biosysnthesis protein [Nitrosomonadales bacterium]